MSMDLATISAAQQLMAKTFARQPVSLPLGRDIFLLETHVAGLRYHQARDALPNLRVGTALSLRREPGNSHDELAIEVFVLESMKLGYIPRHRNPVLARLMDAGKQLLASVASVGADPRYETDGIPDIRFSIVLRD
ncbi:MAG: HIRAN domain-containing protein [Rhodocyclaceae bacterium]|nr:HIRAN domain-containing protein [Rhodocyclaceae bacterium]